MSIKNDRWIKMMAKEYQMIKPFEEGQISKGIISYGVSSYGYDIRIADEFRVLEKYGLIDPKNFDSSLLTTYVDNKCIIPPNSFALARTVEYFKIPRNILTICLGKSTYARCGIVVNVTPFEPEWEGFATLEISNTTPNPVVIYANEGIGQVIFLEALEECEVSYADKKGKYQAQKEIVLPKVSNE